MDRITRNLVFFLVAPGLGFGRGLRSVTGNAEKTFFSTYAWESVRKRAAPCQSPGGTLLWAGPHLRSAWGPEPGEEEGKARLLRSAWQWAGATLRAWAGRKNSSLGLLGGLGSNPTSALVRAAPDVAPGIPSLGDHSLLKHEWTQ